MNQALSIARMGNKASLHSIVGADMWGEFILDTGRRAGIDMSNVRISTEFSTTVSLVLIDRNGERRFIAGQGTNRHIDEKCINWEEVKTAKILSVGSAFTCDSMDAVLPELLRFAKSYGVITCMDVKRNKTNPSVKDLQDMLPYTDYIFPNYEEASQLTGCDNLQDIMNAFHQAGANCVVIKIGSKGCCFARPGEAIHYVEAYHIDRVEDTTGAGDNFAAGFITALMEDKPDEECAAFANAAAGFSIQYIGASVPITRIAVEDIMKGK